MKDITILKGADILLELFVNPYCLIWLSLIIFELFSNTCQRPLT